MKYRHILSLFAVLSMLLVALAACGSSTPSGSQEVDVTLTGTTITSSVMNFSPGVPYHFIVTNTGSASQAFAMMPVGMDMEHMSLNAIQSNALHMIDTIAPGMSSTFDYTFASSMMGHNFEFAGNMSGHNTGWMRLPMTINH
jgi:hypothetical protein